MMAWQVTGSCRRGRAHAALERPCEDAIAWQNDTDGRLVCALADGAGSSAYAREAADLCVETACRLALADADWHAAGLVAELRATLLAAAGERPAADFRCTLILLAVDAAGGRCCQLGDGALVLRPAGSTDYQLAFAPDKGAYVNETRFVVDADACTRVRERSIAEPVAFAGLLSDGLERLAIDFATACGHGGFWRPLDRFAAGLASEADPRAEIERFLASEAVQQRCDDDLSLLLVSAP